MLFGGFEVWIDFQRFAEILNRPVHLPAVHHSYTHVISGKVVCWVQLDSFFKKGDGFCVVPTLAYINPAKSCVRRVTLRVNLQGLLQVRYRFGSVRLTGSCET